ncbi:MAG: serine/threonine-protein kinase [Myxococcota bacterium]
MTGNSEEPTGRVLGGRYEVLEPRGTESLGRVYAARDERTGRRVQVKILPPQLAADHERFTRFGREITASFMVTHPNTVEVLDYGEQDGLHFLVLEGLAAHPLAAELAKGKLPVDRAVGIAAQVVQAIGAAHQERIVHRALSPENVLLLENVAPGAGDFVKVRDFGMSKLISDDDTDLTANEIRVGDAAYMAPEYVTTGQFHPKGDLYAVGALLFRMIAGRPPFTGERDRQLAQHVSATAPRLGSVVPGVAPWLDQLVAELLAKDPEARPGVHAVLARIEDGVGHPVEIPPLIPLSGDGAVPAAELSQAIAAEPGSVSGMVLGGAALVVVGAAGLLALVAAAVVVAFVLTLPS